MKKRCLPFGDFHYKLNALVEGSMVEGKQAFPHFDEDNTIAEIFLPETPETLLLNSTKQGNWEQGEYMLISWKGFVLQKNGIPIFGG